MSTDEELLGRVTQEQDDDVWKIQVPLLRMHEDDQDAERADAHSNPSESTSASKILFRENWNASSSPTGPFVPNDASNEPCAEAVEGLDEAAPVAIPMEIPERQSYDGEAEQKEKERLIDLSPEITFDFESGARKLSDSSSEYRIQIDVNTQTEAEIQYKHHNRRFRIPVATGRWQKSKDPKHINEETESQEITSIPSTAATSFISTGVPHKDVMTYQKALYRIKAIEAEQNKRLYLKKNLFTALLLKWQRWRKALHFSVWSVRIQAVEGKHGSKVGLTMYFLRWIVFLNFLIAALWVTFTVVPFVFYPPPTFSWRLFSENNATDILSGEALGYTWFLYGGYQYPLHATYGIYEPGIAFPLAACLMLFGSLLSLLIVIGKRIAGEGDSSVIEQNRTYPFSSVVFASWDFHLDDRNTMKHLKNAIRSQIREMLHDAEWNQKTTTFKEQLLTGTTKLIGMLVIWPIIVGITAAAMFYTIERGDTINAYFGFSFAQSITITLVSLLGQFLVRGTVRYEGWHPRVAQQVEAAKLFSVKMINLAVILYKMYEIQQRAAKATELMEASDAEELKRCIPDQEDCPTGLTCCDRDSLSRFDPAFIGRCVPVCEENEMGLIFYRLILTNGFILLLQEIAQALFVSKILRKKPNIDAEKFFVNIIDTQALVWLGSIVAPLLPLFGIVSNVANFYVKTWLALKVYEPGEVTCSASRNSNLQYTLTLLTLVFSALPLTSFVYEKRDLCGPNTGESMANAVSRRLRRAPTLVKTLIRWATNPIILGGALLVASFFLMLERVHKRKWQRRATTSQKEFSAYRYDMQLKLREKRSKSVS